MRGQVAAALAVAVLLAGCTGGADPAPAQTATPPSSPSPSPSGTSGTAAPDGAVTAEVVHLDAPVTLSVHPLQVQDDVALLTVDYTVADDAPDGARVDVGALLMPATGPVGAGGVRVVDVDAGRVHPVGEDTTKQPAATRESLGIGPGETATTQGFYAAPSSDSVAVMFPHLGVVLDVPVEPVTGAEGLPVTPSDLGREGEISYSTAPLDAFTVAYDSSSSARVQGDAATVSLASDVLFGVDQSVLSPEAEAVVAAAADEILAHADGGQVAVVGHTDDVASDEYNQALSVQRAQSVAAVLTARLGAGFAVVPEGRGETEPAVPGASAEARAANRRVEVRFTAAESGAAVEVGTGAAAPEPTGPVATGDGAARVELRGSQTDVRAASVRRHGPYLVGMLEVERVSVGTDGLLELFGTAIQGLDAGRGLTATTLIAGAHNVTLLGESSRYFPVDYLREESAGGSDRRATLADQFLTAQLDQGDTVTVSVVWPDPGGDTVTIDVPDRFRLTDVPVVDG